MKASLLLHRLLAPALSALLWTSPVKADPGDTTWAFSSLESNFFPPYSAFTAFADQITGSGTGPGFQSSAYRFTSVASGPLEYVQVILYAPAVGPASSVKVALHTDAGGQIGARIAEFPIASLTAGGFRGYFAYHNYGNLEPNEAAYLISKGRSYWVSVEPNDPNTLVYWAQSLSTKSTKKYRYAGGTGSYPNGTRNTPAGATVAVFEPYPPEIQSPGTPLVEGEQVPDEATGVTLSSVGAVPQSPCLGSILVNRKKVPCLLGADGKVKLRVGDAAPALPGTVITKIGEPAGDITLLTLRRQSTAPIVTAANDVVLIGGVRTPPLRVIARTGEAIVGGNGALISKFLSIDGGGTSSFFTVQLAGPGVTSKNNAALAAAPGADPARILVRKDDTVGAGKVTVIGTLAGFPASTGEGRWRADDGALGVRLTLSDRSNHLFTIPATAASQLEWQAWSSTGVPLAAPLADAVIKSMGAPGFGPDGVVFAATLQTGRGGVTTANDAILLHQTVTGGLTIIAREGDIAPGRDGNPMADSAKFTSFGNPVHGPAGKLAFIASLKAGSNKSGLFWLNGAAPLRLVARAGDPAPMLGTFSKFTNLVFRNTANGTPIFKAKLATQSAAKVNSATSDGIWAINSAGEVVIVARNGSYTYLNNNLYGTASGISALLTAAGSPGAEHGLDGDGSVRIHGTISNRASPGKKKAQFPVPIPQP